MIALAVCLLLSAGAFLGAATRRFGALGWLLHAYARSRGAVWFTDWQSCPGCARVVRVMRLDPVAEGYLCVRCSSGSAR